MQKKIVAIIVTILLVVNIVLFAMQQISSMTFWIVILAAFVIAQFILPKLN